MRDLVRGMLPRRASSFYRLVGHGELFRVAWSESPVWGGYNPVSGANGVPVPLVREPSIQP